MQALLHCKNLMKKMSESFALRELNIEIHCNDTVALIGPNGAGKTTLFQIITGNLDCDSGEVQFQGKTFRPETYKQKKKLGYLSQDLNLPQWVTPIELLNYSASLHAIAEPQKRIEEQIDRWEIVSYKNRPLASCSHGMKKRAALAVALLHSPELLILDEPFAGLDIRHIKSLKQMIKERTKSEKATIVSTHILPYASELCNKAYTIKDGQLNKIENWHNMNVADQLQKVESHFFSKA